MDARGLGQVRAFAPVDEPEAAGQAVHQRHGRGGELVAGRLDHQRLTARRRAFAQLDRPDQAGVEAGRVGLGEDLDDPVLVADHDKLAARGAGAAEPPADRLDRLLAQRAAFGLPYATLLRHTSDPLGDLKAGRLDGLIAAVLEDAGLRARVSSRGSRA